MLSARALRVVFGRTIALDGVDLEVEPGIVGLFGPNGSGKSTLLRTFAGLQRPEAGSVALEGRVVDLNDESFRARVGYAGHAAGLYDRLTVQENLELFASLYGAPREAPREAMDRLVLHDRAATQVRALSAGWKRRVAVARALVHDPDVLLLDEPYANLDVDASEIVSQAIKTWARPDKLAVIATHGAKRVRAYASSGIVLRDGNVTSQRDGFREVSL